MTITLTHPWVIRIGGATIVLVLLFRYTKKEGPTAPFQFASLLKKNRLASLVFYGYRLCILCALACCFFVLSGPHKLVQTQPTHKKGIDIVVALDVSYSMEATDLSPNRLESAKRALQYFLTTRTSDRVGLVVFAGKPFVSVPLTFDYDIFAQILSGIQTTTIDQQYTHLQGTAIGDALLSSMAILEKADDQATNEKPKERIIVLFTDGEANVGVDPNIVASLAREKKIKIYTIGIGSIEGGMISFPTTFGMRQQLIKGVDETLLRGISETTDGRYARAVSDDSLTEILSQIAQLTRSDLEEARFTTTYDTTTPFIIGAIFCLSMLLVGDRKVFFG